MRNSKYITKDSNKTRIRSTASELGKGGINMLEFLDDIPEGIPRYLTILEVSQITGVPLKDIKSDIRDKILLKSWDPETNQVLIPSWQFFPKGYPPLSIDLGSVYTDNLDLSIFLNRTEED